MLGVLEILPSKNSTAEEQEQEQGLFFIRGGLLFKDKVQSSSLKNGGTVA
jgi:hypothetical protein